MVVVAVVEVLAAADQAVDTRKGKRQKYPTKNISTLKISVKTTGFISYN